MYSMRIELYCSIPPYYTVDRTSLRRVVEHFTHMMQKMVDKKKVK